MAGRGPRWAVQSSRPGDWAGTHFLSPKPPAPRTLFPTSAPGAPSPGPWGQKHIFPPPSLSQSWGTGRPPRGLGSSTHRPGWKVVSMPQLINRPPVMHEVGDRCQTKCQGTHEKGQLLSRLAGTGSLRVGSGTSPAAHFSFMGV